MNRTQCITQNSVENDKDKIQSLNVDINCLLCNQICINPNYTQLVVTLFVLFACLTACVGLPLGKR